MNAWFEKVEEYDLFFVMGASRIIGGFFMTVFLLVLCISYFVNKSDNELLKASPQKGVHSSLSLDLNKDVLLSPLASMVICSPRQATEHSFYLNCKTTASQSGEEEEWRVSVDQIVYKTGLSFKLFYDKKDTAPFLLVSLNDEGKHQISRSVALEVIKKAILEVNEDLRKEALISQSDANAKSWKEGDINGN